MAKDNRIKKGAAVPFDENLLIGKLSGLTRSTPSAPAQAAQPAGPESDTTAQQQPAPAPVAEKTAGEREEEKVDTVAAAAPAASAPVSNSKAEAAPAGQPAKKPRSGKAWDYGRFLVATDTKKKAHVYITDENHQKIKQVLSLFGNKLAIADYLDNLLAQHWEQYDPEIQERMQQIFSKK